MKSRKAMLPRRVCGLKCMVLYPCELCFNVSYHKLKLPQVRGNSRLFDL